MLDFGWQVSTTDSGDAGAVTAAMYDTVTKDLTGVVVRRGEIATRDIVVPSEYISSVADEVVGLTVVAAELEQFDDFRLHRYVSPELDLQPPQNENPGGEPFAVTPSLSTGDPTNPWTVGGQPLIEETTCNVVEGSVVFWQEQDVVSSDTTFLGKLTHLVYDGDALSGVIVRPDKLFGSGRLVPFEQVAETLEDQAVLSVDAAGFRTLPDAAVS